ncbi:MAG: hypothetical protein WC429_05780 [Verrucomicrobiia bacterium]|jgi:hypothetical protein
MNSATQPDSESENACATHGGPTRRLSRRDFFSAAALGAGAMPALLSAKEPEATARTLNATAPGAHEKATTYATLNRESWASVLADKGEGYTPPLTVHLPIQPVFQRDFVHVDCALNVCRRRVLPKLSTGDPASWKAARTLETFVVQFAVDDPPLVPDFRATQLSLAEGKYPLAHASYFICDLLYEFDYFCCPLDERQSVLWIGVSVRNDADAARRAHVRAKVNFQMESRIFDPHYVPFYWDATKWLPCDKVQLKDNAICRDAAPIGRTIPGDWMLEWEAKKEFDAKRLPRYFNPGPEYRVAPSMRLASVQDVMHFSAELRAGEQKRFWIALLTDFEGATVEDRERLMRADPQAGRAAALKHFQSQFSHEHAQLVFPNESWDRIFTELQLSTLQLLVQFPGEKSLMPTQGGSSERFFVWVWEAMFMLLPMLRLGHFEPVRRSLEFIFSLQDGGHPPEGELTTTAGAIGTTGPKWLNTTGSALALATDYYLYSRDEEFLKAYLPKMLKAMNWIVGELRATRKLNPDGSRPLYYGLMPFGCATDGDIGRIVAVTDAFTFWGLEKAVTLLEQTRHAQAAEFRRELDMYRADLTRAIEGMTRPDGYIERKILTGKEKRIEPGFERICSAIILAYIGALDVRSDHFRRFVAYFEEKLMDGFFTGRMTADIAYMGVGEFSWHHAYLRQGEWKKAFAANRINLRYGMTQDTFQVQERFSRTHANFTPWQPNGSGNGRMLEMMLNSLYFEHDGRVTLLGGVPFLWLANNGVTALQNLRTTRGSVSLEARMLDRQRCRLTVRASDRGVLPRLIQVPDHFVVSDVSPRALTKGRGLLQISGDAQELRFVLRETPET